MPPPLEGAISLGIYDQSGGLVRVLHHEAKLDEFTVGEDALLTKWDGKNDHGENLPSGKYHARGYLVGRLKVEDVAPHGRAVDRTTARQKKTGWPVRFELTANARGAGSLPAARTPRARGVDQSFR